MLTLLFIRHGATKGNRERRYIGWTDEPLSEQGREQICLLLERHLQPQQVFVSPALRTRESAQLLFPEQEPVVVPDLMETNFGLFENKTAAELSRCPEYRAWLDTMCQGDIPGGESVKAFKARCIAAFSRIAETLPEEGTVAFVVHGGVIMAILEAFAMPKRDFYDYHIPNGGFISCQYKNKRLCIQKE